MDTVAATGCVDVAPPLPSSLDLFLLCRLAEYGVKQLSHVPISGSAIKL
jgi:hypothetical protein